MTPPPISPRRRQIARATLWVMAGFVFRRAADLVVLWLIGRRLPEESYGLFRQWQAVILPLYALVGGGWDTVLQRRRWNKAAAFRILVMWATAMVVLCAAGLLLFADSLARWYRDPLLAPLFRLGGLVVLFDAGRRAARTVLSDRLDFGTIARWELIRTLVFGVGVVGMIVAVGWAAEPWSAERIAVHFVIIFLVAEAVEAAGLLVLQQRGTAYPGARLPGPHAEMWRRHRGPLRSLRLRAAWRRDASFARVWTFDTFLNAVGIALPVYYIGRYVDSASVTYFNYALAIVAIPLYAVLESAQRVLLPGLSAVNRADLPGRTMLVVEVLSLLTLPMLVWTAVYAPRLFVVLFNEEWRIAGEITRLLVLYLLLAPVTNVCGPIEAIIGAPEIGLVWNLVTFAGRAGVLWVGMRWGGLMEGIALYAVFSLGMWLLYQVLIARMLGITARTWCWSWGRFAWLWAGLGAAWWWALSRRAEAGLADMLLWGAAGMAFYGALLAIVHPASFRTLLSLRHFREPQG